MNAPKYSLLAVLLLFSLGMAACGGAAGSPRCEAGSGEVLVQPEGEGFCLSAPAEFTHHQYEAGHHVVYYGQVEQLIEPPQPFLMIEIEDHDGRDLDELGAAYLAAYTGIELAWQEAELGGQRALRIDQLPGQELGRVLLTIHDGRVYELLFVPDDEAAGEAHERMESLYDRVTESFQFIDE